jgi:hypothetical protein
MNLFCVANSFTRLLDGLVPRTIRIAASQQIHGPSTNYTCGGTDRLTLLSTFNCPSRSDICMSLRATETVACMHLSSTAHRACTLVETHVVCNLPPRQWKRIPLIAKEEWKKVVRSFSLETGVVQTWSTMTHICLAIGKAP